MTTLDDRLEFSRKYITAPDGKPFSTQNRQWLIDEFYLPLCGYKLWPVKKNSTCNKCRAIAGRVVEDFYSHEETRSPGHSAENKGCQGLRAHVIKMLLLELPRQTGKSVGAAGHALPTIFKDHNESIAYIAGSEEQAIEIFENIFKRPIISNSKLKTRCRIVGNKITVQSTSSHFIVLPTSLAVAGASNTLIILDEARQIPSKVAMAMLPTIFARNGWKCPTGAKGHTKTNGDLDDPEFKMCKVCGARLCPWSGTLLAMSSATQLEGGDKDWFAESCVLAEEDPSPDVYVYKMHGEIINPTVAASTVGMMSDFFGKIESTSTLVDVEAHNISRRKGEPFLTSQQINAAVDPTLLQADGGTRPAVAFLDTSISKDLSSFVVVEDDSEELEDDWHRLVVVRIDTWDPKTMPKGLIDPKFIRQHLDTYVPSFALVAVRVDTRVMPWAKFLVADARKTASYRHIIDGISWRESERAASWSKLEEYILGNRIRLPPNEILKAELRAARRKTNTNNRIDIREANRNKRHLDVAESLAACAFMAHQQSVSPKGPGLSSTVGQKDGKNIINRLNNRLNRPLSPKIGARWT